MRIEINKVKLMPKDLGFGFCVYGTPTQEINEWVNYWKLKTESSGKFTNIFVDDVNLLDIFEDYTYYKYMDSFSPNLNKYLHLGHLSNLIIAKSLQSLGISDTTIAILGDTLEGAVTKEDALFKFKEYCSKFDYNIDEIFGT